MELLNKIDFPEDLRRLPEQDLPKVAEELRAHILEVISRVGGHLSSNLGTVELTVALHYVFNTPADRIVWDVGHQTYGHKILTGRRDRLDTIRQKGGLSGFPMRTESEYDTFGTAHASTSIAAALGMSCASRRLKTGGHTIAVVGDGAMSGGMVYEGLNNAGVSDENILVVLNDNEMSISHPVGAMRNYLARILTSPLPSRLHDDSRQFLDSVPLAPVKKLALRAQEHLKGMVMPSTLFEELGFEYSGPLDGHDLRALVPALRKLRGRSGRQFLHVVTRKGKGFGRAESDPVGYHGVGKFEPDKGLNSAGGGGGTYSELFGEWLCAAADRDDRLVAITPAMCEGSGLVEFSKRFPSRYFDVGIAEQHAVTFAAGLACGGMRPVVAIYSTFLQRAYDQLIHDVAIQELPVVFAIDRGGLVGADGATHHGAFDLSYLRCIPNLTVMAPSDGAELSAMLDHAVGCDGPVAVRYPRGRAPEPVGGDPVQDVSRAVIRRRGEGLAVLAFGAPVTAALEATRELNATVVDMRFVKPLDEETLLAVARDHGRLATVEENVVSGGAGSAVAEALQRAGVVKPLRQLGLPDRFVGHGKPEELLAECGLDAAGLRRSLSEFAAA